MAHLFPGLDFNPAIPSTYLKVAGWCLHSPTKFFQGLERATGLVPPLVFLGVTSLAAWLLGLALAAGGGAPWGQSLASLLNQVVQPILVALLIWLAARWALKTRLALGHALRVVAYPGVVWLAAPLGPVLPHPGGVVLLALVAIVHLYVMMKGLVVLAGTSVPLAIACQAIALVSLMLLGVVLAQLG